MGSFPGGVQAKIRAAQLFVPRRRALCSVSAEGLLEASKFVQDFSGNIAGTLGNLGKTLWPDFHLPGQGGGKQEG